jgi:transcriptional regulator with XRE-family HTH domain
VNLRALREYRKLSQSALSFAMYDADAEEGRGYDPSFIARIERGERRPPYRFMVLAGRVLKPSITEFPEYHLAMARRALDETEVGLEQALISAQEHGFLIPDETDETPAEKVARGAEGVDRARRQAPQRRARGNRA